MGFSWQEIGSGFPFPPPVDLLHVLSELFAMNCPPWVARRAVAYSFIELGMPLHPEKAYMKGSIHEVIHEGEH